MSQTLPVNNFEWIEDTSKFNADFIKSYNEKGDGGYFLKPDVQYPEKIHEIYSDLPFLIERMKFEKLATNLHDKTEYVIYIVNLNQTLNLGLVFKKVHRAIKFNQKAWLKLYIDMSTKLRKKTKNNFEKDFSKLINNAVFGKAMENVIKHGNIELDKQKGEEIIYNQNYLASKNVFQ